MPELTDTFRKAINKAGNNVNFVRVHSVEVQDWIRREIKNNGNPVIVSFYVLFIVLIVVF